MPTQLSNLQLQLALAKELPKLITSGNLFSKTIFVWIHEKDIEGNSLEVTPHEWDWIVKELEQRLVSENKHLATNLAMESVMSWPMSWQNRATAYFRTIGKEIV